MNRRRKERAGGLTNPERPDEVVLPSEEDRSSRDFFILCKAFFEFNANFPAILLCYSPIFLASDKFVSRRLITYIGRVS